MKFCHDVYTLCNAEGDLHGFHQRVKSGNFNWLVEAMRAFEKLQQTNDVVDSVNKGIEDFLDQIATEDSQFFHRISPLFKERTVYSTVDSTVIIDKEGHLKPYCSRIPEQLLNDVAPTVGGDQEEMKNDEENSM